MDLSFVKFIISSYLAKSKYNVGNCFRHWMNLDRYILAILVKQSACAMNVLGFYMKNYSNPNLSFTLYSIYSYFYATLTFITILPFNTQ